MHLLVPLHHSRILQSLYALLCVLVLLALLLAAAPLWLRCACGLAWFIEVLKHVRSERPIGLVLTDSGLHLSFAERSVAVRLHRHCFCNRYLIVIRLRELSPAKAHGRGARYFSLVLLPDSCSTSVHRQLRTALRWHCFDARVLLP